MDLEWAEIPPPPRFTVDTLQMADVIDEAIVGVTRGLAMSGFSANLLRQTGELIVSID